MPDLVILMGIPASGKSTFYERTFSTTHVRINLDMLRTRHREIALFSACISSKQSLVIDNTNVTRAERSLYIPWAKKCGFDVSGYQLVETMENCLKYNQNPGRTTVPDKALYAKQSQFEPPDLSEGFDFLYKVAKKEFDGKISFLTECVFNG